jgi:hypothetical protein
LRKLLKMSGAGFAIGSPPSDEKTLTGEYVSEKIELAKCEVPGYLDSKLLPASAQ